MGTNKGYGSWIFAGIVVLYGWILNKLFKLVVPSAFKVDKKATCSSTYSNYLTSVGGEHVESISKLFEEMCILDPLSYEDDPELNHVIDSYAALVKGRILDPDGEHIPSISIDGENNPDYYRYLKNQKKAQAKAGLDVTWLTKEMERVTAYKNVKEVKEAFMEQLVAHGMSPSYLEALMDYDRLESYTPADWKAVTEAVSFAEEQGWDESVIREFISNVYEVEYYKDHEVIDRYCFLRTDGNPAKISLEYSKNRLTYEQTLTAITLVDKGYSEEEAMLKVLVYVKDMARAEELKSKYRSKV